MRDFRREDGMVTLIVNGVRHGLDIEPETPLLGVMCDELGLTGTNGAIVETNFDT